jgi:hypothetical protein
VAAIRRLLEPGAVNIPEFQLSVAVTFTFAVLLWLASTLQASRPAKESQA